MVAALGLLDPVQVLLERLLGLPGGAVDPLQLLVLLVAAPVRRRGPHQLEGRDPLGGRQVRAAAQVVPDQRAVALEVVVDGQLAGADLDARPLGGVLGGPEPLSPISSSLYGSSCELARRLVVADHAAGELLALLDDLAHPRLDLLEVLRGERASRRRSRSRSRSRPAGRCPAWRPGRAPAPPGPARARSSAAGCRGRRRSRSRRPRPVAVGELVGQVAQARRRPGPRSRPGRRRTAPRPSCPWSRSARRARRRGPLRP